MSWLRDIMPVPLAAPETAGLRRARYLTMGSCVVVAAIVLFFEPLHAALGPFTLPMLVAAATYSIVQSWLWITAKNAADDAWLYRESDDVA
ncbi:MAG: hypothetical protein AAFQ13_07945 [Pseudomonadota bacterium]